MSWFGLGAGMALAGVSNLATLQGQILLSMGLATIASGVISIKLRSS